MIKNNACFVPSTSEPFDLLRYLQTTICINSKGCLEIKETEVPTGAIKRYDEH